MIKYDSLSQDIAKKIEYDRKVGAINPYACQDDNAIRRDNNRDNASIFRSNFIRDIDKIINHPFYSRYADKTQVFSFYKNDDISRRSLHVQLVSRIARTIGKALNLNLELIEAIALGHDLGHTPFGHSGEKILNNIYQYKTGKIFAHNLQSVRVLDKIYPSNVTLQTLDGIATHNGEVELETYFPSQIDNFNKFDVMLNKCYDKSIKPEDFLPSTLEGCVVRLCDIIAYLGKDRQDAEKIKAKNENSYANNHLGNINAEIINNLSVNIIENSYGKNYIKLSAEYFKALQEMKNDNYVHLYNNKEVENVMANKIAPAFEKLYDKLLVDLLNSKKSSPIFTSHIDYINKPYIKRTHNYLDEEPNQIVVDFIASMTDDFFIDIYNHLFPDNVLDVKYKSYF